MNFQLFRKFATVIQKIVNSLGVLQLAEKIYTRNCEVYERPIFIIGAPRSGSTWFLQLLLSGYRFSYISNLASLLYTSPSLATSIMLRFSTAYSTSNFKSTFGYVNGLNAPSEGGKLVDYWFGKDPVNVDPNITKSKIMKKSINKISKLLDGPFIVKNLKLSLQLPKLTKLFPNAIFINITRKPLYNAQSIILAKRALKIDEKGWFSFVLPDQEELLKLELYEQVVHQISYIEKFILKMKKQIHKDNFIEIKYNDLCNNTTEIVDEVVNRLKHVGIDLYKKGEVEIKVQSADFKRLPNDDWKRLHNAISKYY